MLAVYRQSSDGSDLAKRLSAPHTAMIIYRTDRAECPWQFQSIF